MPPEQMLLRTHCKQKMVYSIRMAVTYDKGQQKITTIRTFTKEVAYKTFAIQSRAIRQECMKGTGSIGTT